MKKNMLWVLALVAVITLAPLIQDGLSMESTDQTTTITTTQTENSTNTTTQHTNVTAVTITKESPTTILATTTIPVFFSYTTTSLVTVIMGIEPKLGVVLSLVLVIIAILVGYTIGLKTRKEGETTPPPVQPKPAKKVRR